MDRGLNDYNNNDNNTNNDDDNNNLYVEVIRRMLQTQSPSGQNAAAPLRLFGSGNYPTPQIPWQPGGHNGGDYRNTGSNCLGTASLLDLFPIKQQPEQQQQPRADSSSAAVAAEIRLLAAFSGNPPQNLLRNQQIINQQHSPATVTERSVSDVAPFHAWTQEESSAPWARQGSEPDRFPPPPAFLQSLLNSNLAGFLRLRLSQRSSFTPLPNNNPLLPDMPSLGASASLHGLGTTATDSAVDGTSLPSSTPAHSNAAAVFGTIPTKTENMHGTHGSATHCPSGILGRKRARSECSQSSDSTRADLKRDGDNKKRPAGRRAYTAISFARKLFKMVTDQETQGKRDVVEFLDGGGGFWLHDPDAIPELMPKYGFRGTKFSGFRRQLTSYGFKVDRKEGPEKGAFKNPLFSRGRPDLCSKIIRDNHESSDDKVESSVLSNKGTANYHYNIHDDHDTIPPTDLSAPRGGLFVGPNATALPPSDSLQYHQFASEAVASKHRGHIHPESTPKRRAYNVESFAQKLFKMITDQEASGKRDVVEFLDGGGGFWLHDPSAIPALMPLYNFRGTKFSGFRRQLTSYGFVREMSGPDAGAFKNPLFCRGRPDRCEKIIRDGPVANQNDTFDDDI